MSFHYDYITYHKATGFDEDSYPILEKSTKQILCCFDQTSSVIKKAMTATEYSYIQTDADIEVYERESGKLEVDNFIKYKDEIYQIIKVEYPPKARNLNRKYFAYLVKYRGRFTWLL